MHAVDAATSIKCFTVCCAQNSQLDIEAAALQQLLRTSRSWNVIQNNHRFWRMFRRDGGKFSSGEELGLAGKVSIDTCAFECSIERLQSSRQLCP